VASRCASVLVSMILPACATDDIESAGAPVVAGEQEAGTRRDAAIPGSNAHAVEPPEAAPTDPWANLPDPWDYFYPPGSIPPGPPPMHCIAPCLYEALVACGVPGAGTPLPDPATCRHSSEGFVRSLCDEVAKYLMVSRSGASYYQKETSSQTSSTSGTAMVPLDPIAPTAAARMTHRARCTT
jgi:hypothetical protein